MSRETLPNLKILLIGNSSVGKSSLLLRFSSATFLPPDEATATIGVDFKVKTITVRPEGPSQVKLSIWDTAGQERFRVLTGSYYRGAMGVVLVYDISSRTSFDELVKWLTEIDTYCSTGVCKLLVGNKVDRELSRQVSTTEGREFAQRMGMGFIECSAMSNTGVDDLFEQLARNVSDTCDC
ncbi:small GTPase superfamily [Dioszegia hungarica]|uniref:Small GTPase superfamily n=1 Tax=Dioszegia hungarica TaxID=4972 RepID=A0AA38H7L1_9TREE|nr:small GTPase superfamily [Dioszegia hungarica]KAI9635178.1 small GTPase superfamily [Dioszegia hungarica]